MSSNDNEEIYMDALSDICSDIDNLSTDDDDDDNDDDDDDIDVDDDEHSTDNSDFTMKAFSSVKQSLSSDSEEDNKTTRLSENDEWVKEDAAPKLNNFTEQSGIQIPSDDTTNSIDSVIKFFIGDDLIDLFVRESNKYQRQNCRDNCTSSNKAKQWTDITFMEMKKFLGLIILMTFIRKSDKNEYWSTDPLLRTPIFSEIISRNRFRQIWKYWHFNDNEHLSHGRLSKIEPVLTYFLQRFRTVYKPKRELSLDKGIIPWRGRLSFHIHNPVKTIKHGIVVHMVCEAKSRYICNMEICCKEEKELHTTIFNVLQPFLNLWHDVYMENSYSSVKIAEELLKHKTRVCGTIKKNGIPRSLINVALKKSSTAFRRKNDILIQAWKSKNKLLYMISTIHTAKMVSTGKVDSSTNQEITKPLCIVDYDKYMKSIDRADRYLLCYSALMKTKKWTKKAILYLLNCALFNAFNVYRMSSNSNIKYKKFLLSVARNWLTIPGDTPHILSDEPGLYIVSKRAPKYDPPTRLSLDISKHKLAKIIGHGKILNSRRPCRVCTSAKKRSSTGFMCSFCGVPLHVGKCFEKYHTSLKY